MDAAELTREEAREVDRRTIEEYGIPSILLMENAGRACAAEVQALLAARSAVPTSAAPVLVLCGPGNNGGDGLVIARTLANRGVPVEVVFVGEAGKLEGAAGDFGTNLHLWRGLGREVEIVFAAAAVAQLRPRLRGAAVLVDALFGTGLDRELCPPWLDVVRALGEAGRPVLAVDVPSGLDANTGEVLGAAVRAEVTVTFVGPKRGFRLAAGPRCCGRVVVAEIGIPRAFLP
ncbi:MAG: NAD(P)H-hydrate epimerase [Planctomycetota bacterium]